MRYIKWAIIVAALVIGISLVYPNEAKSATIQSLPNDAILDNGGVFPETPKPKPIIPEWNAKIAATEYKGGKRVTVTKRVNTHSPSKPIVEGSKAIYYKNMAYAPSEAPKSIKMVVWAGNKIQNLPYVWGGGHGSWNANGYDCSGSVSYVLHEGKLLNTTMVSGDLASWGRSGNGQWITIYANDGHAYMAIAGLRFDTSGANPSRWQPLKNNNYGYSVRHPNNL